MYAGKTLFAQIMDYVPWTTFALRYRTRPYGDNPEKCIFEAYALERYPKGEEPKKEWVEEEPTAKFWGTVLEQDFNNMLWVQKGIKLRGIRGTLPNPHQEQKSPTFIAIYHVLWDAAIPIKSVPNARADLKRTRHNVLSCKRRGFRPSCGDSIAISNFNCYAPSPICAKKGKMKMILIASSRFLAARMVRLSLPVITLSAASCVATDAPRNVPLAPEAHYVAMGSSFAAGPGVGVPADEPANRCGRSSDNYAHQLARKYDLHLTDVSCGGATTAHILGPWNELPAQVEALRPDTALVTITIGGNDVNYIGGLMAGSCEQPSEGPAARVCKGLATRATADPEARSRSVAASSEDAWQTVEAGLRDIVREVRRRSPDARLVFVDYLSIVPEDELCAKVPLSDDAATSARATASRLAKITAHVALSVRAELVRASEMSRDHDACASDPWMYGFFPSDSSGQFVPYHPNLAGMTAIAEAIGRNIPAANNTSP